MSLAPTSLLKLSGRATRPLTRRSQYFCWEWPLTEKQTYIKKSPVKTSAWPESHWYSYREVWEMDTISSSTFQVPTKNGKNHWGTIHFHNCVTVEALHNGYLVAVVGRWPLQGGKGLLWYLFLNICVGCVWAGRRGGAQCLLCQVQGHCTL